MKKYLTLHELILNILMYKYIQNLKMVNAITFTLLLLLVQKKNQSVPIQTQLKVKSPLFSI